MGGTILSVLTEKLFEEGDKTWNLLHKAGRNGQFRKLQSKLWFPRDTLWHTTAGYVSVGPSKISPIFLD
jgi:hypothetical protein